MLRKTAMVSVIFFALLFVVPVRATSLFPSSIEVSKLTETGDQENSPLIYGKKVVYRRHSSPDVNIYSYDLKTKSETLIVDRPGHQSPVQLSNQYLLYNEDTQDATDQQDVRIKDLRSGKDVLISGGEGNQSAGAIFADKVAYIKAYDCGELVIHSIRRNADTDTGVEACLPLRLWGDTIVWSDNENIYGYSMSRGYKFDVVNEEGEQYSPYVSSGKVIWIDHKDGVYSVKYKYLFSNRFDELYSTSTSRLSAPVVSNRYAAWVDDRGLGAHDIAVKNLYFGDVELITDNGSQQSSPTLPDIYLNKIVWMSWHTGNGDIYLGNL